MKNLILPIFLLATFISMAQDYKPNLTLPESKKLGLVAYLSHVKTVSEIMLLEKGDDAKKWYFSIKENSDVFINQLCADMTDRRGLKLYRELNKDIGNKNYTSKYKFLIDKIDTAFKEIKKTPDENKFDNLLETLGIDPYSIYKDVVSAKTKKVEGLITQLKELKLQPLEKKEKKSE